MALGVYVAGEDQSVVEAVTLAIERSEELFVAPAVGGADVVVADVGALDSVEPPPPAAVVVLATSNPVAAAREAMDRGADGFVAWPDDEADLTRLLYGARTRRAPDKNGLGSVVEVMGARGGAGTTTVVTYLARALSERALIVDASGGAAGHELFAIEDPPATLTSLDGVMEQPTPEAVRSALGEHQSGVPCLFGGEVPADLTQAFVFACRSVATLTLVDGPAPDADMTLIVLTPDVGSVRAAARLASSCERVEFVLNRTRPKGLSTRSIARTLGRRPIAVVPHDPTLARKADLGCLRKHGPAVRALRKLASRARREK